MPNKTRRLIGFLPLLILLLNAAPCHALIYDGGSPTGNGPILTNNSTTTWAAARFMLNSDAYGTRFGTALYRMNYIPGAGFDVYLTTTLSNVPSSAIAHWTLTPTGTATTYYYGEAESPILLRANQVYALVITPNCDGFSGAVSYAYKPGAAYLGLGSGDYGQTWRYLGMPLSVQVDGWFVPEPGSLGILILGLTGTVAFKHNRRKAVG
ncbi:MAG: PEP-CTERM sorting domain-containing protein [Armatimonadota bacterium]|nr:PEP-CTERM sorting domain-containing protein [bacterium]